MSGHLRRVGSAALFAASAAVFVLPFGSGVLDGARVWPRVSFTGIELATWQVQHESQFVPAGRAAVHEFEAGASLPALILLALVLLGFAFALVGRPGGGICAGVAVVGMLWLTWQLGDNQLIGGNRIEAGIGVTLLQPLVALAAVWHFFLRGRRESGPESPVRLEPDVTSGS
jgi:hypothetical protein